MHKSIFIAIFGIFLLVGFTGQTAHAPTYLTSATLRYRIQLPTDLNEVKQLTKFLLDKNFDIAGVNQNTNTMDIITDEAGVEVLNANDLKGDIIGHVLDLAPDKRFLNPTTLLSKLQAINQAAPQITRVVELGKTNQGRPLTAILISTTLDVNDPAYHLKPTIIMDGLHHAREIMTPEIIVDVAETIIKNASTPAIQNLVKNWNIWLIPMMNPDGSNIVWTNNSMWRKNARADQSNIHGVDINRNYNYRWGECNGSSGFKTSDIYRGATAASEPETQSVVKLAEAVRPTAYLSYHSYGELTLLPYGCKNDLASENEMLQKVGKELASLLPIDSGRGFYKPGTPWQILYGVDGSSMDYYYAAYGAMAYTFEVNQDFQPSYDIREATVTKHRKVWMYFMNRVQNNLLGVDVIDAKTGKPAEAILAVNTITHVKKELPFRTNRAGRFFKALEPGNYKVAAKLADGRVGEIAVTMAGKPLLAKIVIP